MIAHQMHQFQSMARALRTTIEWPRRGAVRFQYWSSCWVQLVLALVHTGDVSSKIRCLREFIEVKPLAESSEMSWTSRDCHVGDELEGKEKHR
jgi:hypothetical protein